MKRGSPTIEICPGITRRTVANGEPRKSTPRRSFGPKFFSPASAQEFHLRFESAHAGGDAFVFFRGPGDRSIDRALADQALKLFVNAQPQHFFPTAGSVSFPKLKQDDVEQGLEFERGPGRKHGDQLLGYVVGHPTCERSSDCFRHLEL